MRDLIAWLIERMKGSRGQASCSLPMPEKQVNGGALLRPGERRELTEPELRHIHANATCPYCRSPLVEGPHGGASINIFCENAGCGSRFNVVDPKFGFVPIGQFTGDVPPELRRMYSMRFQRRADAIPTQSDSELAKD